MEIFLQLDSGCCSFSIRRLTAIVAKERFATRIVLSVGVIN